MIIPNLFYILTVYAYILFLKKNIWIFAEISSECGFNASSKLLLWFLEEFDVGFLWIFLGNQSALQSVSDSDCQVYNLGPTFVTHNDILHKSTEILKAVVHGVSS